MEPVNCEKLLEEMNECIKDNDGTQSCKEVIETFEKICKKKKEEEEEKNLRHEEITKLLLE